jgi:hypothetical protein
VEEDGKTDGYRDELNFAEFPLAQLGARDGGQTCLVFSDTVFDRSLGREVTRKLTISPSLQFGLPTPADDEVILGLVQLTSQQRFASRTVPFTRYELIRLLGWTDDSKSYARVKESLFRWLGVTLHYEKAWWSAADQCWVDKAFHLLDEVKLLDRRSGTAVSSFVWNETVFQSFASGYMKRLDFEFYRSLKSDLAKRLYRFLDKRFHHRDQVKFRLTTLAFEHLGVARSYHNGGLKRLVTRPIAELEARGYLATDEERFRSERRGEWAVQFRKGAQALEERNPLVEELVAFGVSRAVAVRLVATFPVERIRRQLDAVSRKAKGVRNLPGYLVKAIQEGYEARGSIPRGRPLPRGTPKRTPAVGPPEGPIEGDPFEAFWQALTQEQQVAFEAEAVREAEPFLFRQYHDSGQGSLFDTVRRQILRDHWERRANGVVVTPKS